jgi:hypothetical protein
MDSFSLPQKPGSDTFVFPGWSPSSAAQYFRAWRKPANRSFASMLLLGSGGNGGGGAVWSNSQAPGGGGGGSGAVTFLGNIPLAFLPDTLYLVAGAAGASGSNSVQTSVSFYPDINAAHSFAVALGGNDGGNAAAAGAAGSAGVAASVATAGAMPLGWQFVDLALGGQNGTAGGTTGASSALSIPTTGIRVTGGTGGAGLGAAASNGAAAGGLTTQAMPSPYSPQPGGAGTSSATTPPDNGSHGYQVPGLGLFFYGGTGGGATHGSATGGGLVQSSGGNGAFGCGGGGEGGALSGSTAGLPGKGGAGLIIITCW